MPRVLSGKLTADGSGQNTCLTQEYGRSCHCVRSAFWIWIDKQLSSQYCKVAASVGYTMDDDAGSNVGLASSSLKTL